MVQIKEHDFDTQFDKERESFILKINTVTANLKKEVKINKIFMIVGTFILVVVFLVLPNFLSDLYYYAGLVAPPLIAIIYDFVAIMCTYFCNKQIKVCKELLNIVSNDNIKFIHLIDKIPFGMYVDDLEDDIIHLQNINNLYALYSRLIISDNVEIAVGNYMLHVKYKDYGGECKVTWVKDYELKKSNDIEYDYLEVCDDKFIFYKKEGV